MNQLPVCPFRCQDLLLTAIRTNDTESFSRLVQHISKNNLTIDTIKMGETIAEIPLTNKPQWFEQLRTIQKQRFPHQVLLTAAAMAQRSHDVPTLLFVFNELCAHHNLQRNSVLLEIFPIVLYTRQVLCSSSTPEIKKTLPKMLEVCSPGQCRYLILNCLKDENFEYIEFFSSRVDLKKVKEDIQIYYQKGDEQFQSAVAYFQNQDLKRAVHDTQSSLLPNKRKI
jgi:hypothetical protein